jgi:hypothetical protein
MSIVDGSTSPQRLTVEQVCAIFGVPPDTIRNATHPPDCEQCLFEAEMLRLIQEALGRPLDAALFGIDS